MRTVTQYREEIARLVKKVGDIDAKCIAENRDPLDSELSLKTEIMDGIEELRRIVSTQERQDSITMALSAPAPPATRPRPPVEGVPPGDRGGDRFQSFGEQMAAIMRAGTPGGTVDPRLRATRATGLGESVPSDGGFLVQQDFSTTLLQDIFETGILAPRCRRQPISGNANSIKINGVDETSRASNRFGGIVGYWADEAAEKTASKPKFRKIELSLKKLVGLCYATDELLDDGPALEAFIRAGFASEFGFLTDDAIINGTGVGQPLGILNAGCLVTVGKETGQAGSTVVAENIMNMRSRLFASSRVNSIWLVNQNVEPQLHSMALSVGTGGVPVYMPAGGLSGLPYDTLYGRPVMPIEQCASLGTLGDILYVDMGGYILAEKGGIKSDVSIHVMFVYDESVFRFVLRIDGQPVRATALTPYKGGANFTQSHFIALETRT